MKQSTRSAARTPAKTTRKTRTKPGRKAAGSSKAAKTARKTGGQRKSSRQSRLQRIQKRLRLRRQTIRKAIRRFKLKLTRASRRQRKQLHKRWKRLARTWRRRRRLAAQWRRTQSRRLWKPIKAISRGAGGAVYRARLFIAAMLIGGGIGVFYGHQVWVEGYTNALGQNSRQAAQEPGKIGSAGPAQSNSLFSTYPTWAQNFAAARPGQPDAHYWNSFKGPAQNDNHEAQYYTDDPANLQIKDGALALTATHQPMPDGYGYASARIDTENKVSFLYGRIDVMAKLPKGVGTWPAVWFLPANTKYRDLGPATDFSRHVNGGEMDLIEAVGFNPNIEYGVVHTRSDLQNPDHIGDFNQVAVPGNDSNYNRYTMLWTPNSITYEVNGQPFFVYTKSNGADYTTWPFDQPFYLIVNLALGGNWGGADIANFPGNGIDNAALPASLQIQSIYYYSYIGQ